MPRQHRYTLVDIPQHVIQRGNNRKPCFLSDEDRRHYLALLECAARENQCALHAYVLMTNHVHLLATPGIKGGISNMMQSIGRRYVQSFNRRHRRTGTLWEGRYKATVVASDDYLLSCYRYIELNPVRAGMVAHPGDYAWSSYRQNTGAKGTSAISLVPHATYMGLGKTTGVRRARYRELVHQRFDETELQIVRAATQRAWPLGDAAFHAEIETLIQQKIRKNNWGGDRRAGRADLAISNQAI